MLNAWPVMVRELRAEARRPANYWLRVGGAAVFLVAFWIAGHAVRFTPNAGFSSGSLPPSQLGQMFFGWLNAAMFAAIWMVAPLMTADCISRERREDTLGLLFLTPLSAGGIVVGKSFTHGLRALTLCLTAVPVLVLPLVLGGVNAKDVLLALLLDSGALGLALAAGLLATAIARDWVKTALVAEVLSGLFALVFMAVHEFGFERVMTGKPFALPPGVRVRTVGASMSVPFVYHPSGFFGRCAEQFAWCTDQPTTQTTWIWTVYGPRYAEATGGRWTQIWTGTPANVQVRWFAWAVGMALVSALVLAAAVAAASNHVQRTWRANPPAGIQVWCREVFCTPRYYRALFRRRMIGLLERNPVGWLQQHTWSARLTRWGWTLAVISLELFFLRDPLLNDLAVGQNYLAVLLVLSLAFSAAGSFRSERETGALELLLVSPLHIGQILRGRVWGIWRQFFPPVVLLLLAWGYLHFDPAFSEVRSDTWLAHGEAPGVLLGSYITLPLVGLYFSLSRRNLLVAWLLTCGVGLGLPLGLYLLSAWLHLQTGSHYAVPPGGGLAPKEIQALALGALGIQGLIAGIAGWLAWRFLAQRRFLGL